MGNAGLILEFIGLAAIIWLAGTWLTRVTDAIDARYKLGSAFGGLLILGVVTSLPEIAIVTSAAMAHHYGIVIGTLIGGIALQTVVLCLLDARTRNGRPLSFSAASLSLVLEAAMVILVTVASVMAIRTPVTIPHTNISLASLLILALWCGGLWLVFKARKGLPWRSEAIEATPGRKHHERRQVVNHPALRQRPNAELFSILAVVSVATLAAGFWIQSIASQLATNYGIGSGFFAATFLAFVSALPNISTGFGSIDIGDYQLAMSDIFGNNAFLPALFIAADLLAGRSVLAAASSSDIWFAALGVLLTAVFILGLIIRPRKQILNMGLDSITVLALYVAGLVALSVTSG